MEKIPTKQLLGAAAAHRTGSPLKEVQPSPTVAAEKSPEPHFHPHPITSAGATKGLASRTTHSACNDWQEKLIRTTAGAGLSLRDFSPYTSRAGCTKCWWLPERSSFASQEMLPEVVTAAAQSHVPEPEEHGPGGLENQEVPSQSAKSV